MPRVCFCAQSVSPTAKRFLSPRPDDKPTAGRESASGPDGDTQTSPSFISISTVPLKECLNTLLRSKHPGSRMSRRQVRHPGSRVPPGEVGSGSRPVTVLPAELGRSGSSPDRTGSDGRARASRTGGTGSWGSRPGRWPSHSQGGYEPGGRLSPGSFDWLRVGQAARFTLSSPTQEVAHPNPAQRCLPGTAEGNRPHWGRGSGRPTRSPGTFPAPRRATLTNLAG